MKPIIKILLFMLTVVLFPKCEKDNVKNNNQLLCDSLVFIPDTAFLISLIKCGVDTDGDSIIDFCEAEAITYLDVSGTYSTPGEIKNLQGIEAFINLDTLNCYYNQLTTLDVSNNIDLEYLDCHRNQLDSLDITNNAELTFLKCGMNTSLKKLDVSNNSLLEQLYCNSNGLYSIDVSNNTQLRRLNMCFNYLTTLDVSNNLLLTYLHAGCNSMELTSLDVSNNTLLETLHVCCNLSSLDLSNNINLKSLNLWGNELTTLDVSNNTLLEYLDCSDMPTLYEVCVWVTPFPPAGVGVNTKDSPNVYFTTDCSK